MLRRQTVQVEKVAFDHMKDMCHKMLEFSHSGDTVIYCKDDQTTQADSNVIKHVDYFAGLFNFNCNQENRSNKRAKLNQSAESDASESGKALASNENESNFRYTVDFREFRKESVEAILQFVYTGTFDAVTESLLVNIYILADYICLEELRDQLLLKRIPAVYFKADMILELLLLLKDSALPLRDNACEWFCKNRKKVLGIEGSRLKLQVVI